MAGGVQEECLVVAVVDGFDLPMIELV